MSYNEERMLTKILKQHEGIIRVLEKNHQRLMNHTYNNIYASEAEEEIIRKLRYHRGIVDGIKTCINLLNGIEEDKAA